MQENLLMYGECNGDPELMGFWFGWPSKVAGYMKKAGKGKPSGKSINTRLVKTMQKQYALLMVQGYSPPSYTSKVGYIVTWNPGVIGLAKKLKSIVGTSVDKNLNFFQALSHLSSIGKIPFKIYDPSTVQQTKIGLKKAKTQGFFSKLTSGVGQTARMIPIAALGLSALGIFLLTKKKES